MTPDQLDELERLEKAATPLMDGRWYAYFSTGYGWTIQNAPRWLFQQTEDNKNGEHDADFVAALRNAFPALLQLARIGAAAVELRKSFGKESSSDCCEAEGRMFMLCDQFLASQKGE